MEGRRDGENEGTVESRPFPPFRRPSIPHSFVSVERWVMPMLNLLSAGINALPVRLSYALADLGGVLTYWSWPEKRRAAHANFAVAFGQPAGSSAIARIARRSFRTYARMIVDALRLRALPLERLRHWTDLRGLEHLDEGLARGNGVILVAPHLGNWEPASNAVAFVRYQVTAVVDEGLVSRAIAHSRQRVGITLVGQSRAARPTMRALRENRIVLLIADLVKDFRAIPVTLFGRETHIAAGPAYLAVRTGAALVPAVAIRQPDDTSIVYIDPPIFADRQADAAVETRRLAQIIANYFEQVIRTHPEQWYPFRPLWGA